MLRKNGVRYRYGNADAGTAPRIIESPPGMTPVIEIVTPAKAGIQGVALLLDSGFCRNDGIVGAGQAGSWLCAG
jgi:hypothetical protein